MSEDSRYKLTTIERLAPSLEQIDFMLTKTALEQKIESLNFSVSIDKIQSRTFNVFDLGFQDKFQLENNLIQVPYTARERRNSHEIGPTKQDKLMRQSDKIQMFGSKQKKKIIFEHIDLKNRFSKLASTASTIKNVSPSRGSSPCSMLANTMNRTKKSITLKARAQIKRPSKLNEAEKYAPYLQGKKTKKSIGTTDRDKKFNKKVAALKR